MTLLLLILSTWAQSVFAASISTDQLDYPPYSEVLVAGSGFDPGEQVQLKLEALGADGTTWTVLPDDPEYPNPWTVTADENGNVSDSWFVYTEDFLGVTFRLTATGIDSKEVATWIFTDGQGSYSINFAAADPTLYIPPIPFPELLTPIVGRGNGDSQIPGAWFKRPGGADVRVESLAPKNMALHQVVPFEVKITVNGATTPENGIIHFKAGWNIDTTNNSDFGYDESYKVWAAFVDTGDGAHNDPGNNATVASFESVVVGDEIQGTFDMSGLNDGDVVVVEIWLVLEDTIPAKNDVNGIVQSRLIGASTGPSNAPVRAIPGTGGQTVPLNQVDEFYTAEADLSVTKTATPACLGDNVTYTVVVTNPSTSLAVANGIVATDTLGSGQEFVSSSLPSTVSGQIVTVPIGALAPGQSSTFTIVAKATADGTLNNSVVITAITADPDLANNTASVDTTVYPPPSCSVVLKSPTIGGQPATFEGSPVMLGYGYVWNVQYQYKDSDGNLQFTDKELVPDTDASATITLPITVVVGGMTYPADGGIMYLTVTDANGCSSTCSNEFGITPPGDCIRVTNPGKCPGVDQVLTLGYTPAPGSTISWSLFTSSPDVVMTPPAPADGETSVTISSTSCAEYEVTVTVSSPGVAETVCTIKGTFVDTEAPMITSVPEGEDLGCNPASLPTAEYIKGLVEASDDCLGFVTINVDFEDSGMDCAKMRTFSITATDSCGNTTETPSTVTYTWKVDALAPVLANVPMGGDLGCNPEKLPASDDGVTALDNCDGAVGVVCTPGAITGDDCVKSQTFTYSAVDNCGNSVSQRVTYTWKEDKTAPAFAAAPADETVECIGDVVAAGTLAWTDNCDGAGEVLGTDESDGKTCPETITRTWTYTDKCGNAASVSQKITVKDNTPPVFAAAPADETVECIGDVVAAGTLAWTDNCDGAGEVLGTDESDGKTCPETITRTWTYTDKCGNAASVSQKITVKDNTPPVFAAAPADETVECIGDVVAAGTLAWTDNCDGAGEVLGTDESDGKTCPETITRTWTYTDKCGNVASVSQKITVDDNTPPVLAAAPVDATVECIDDVPAAGNLGWTDNCDGSGEVLGTDESDGKTCPETITRTWTYTDKCGNVASVSQKITVKDNTPPVFAAAPADETVECIDDVVAAGTLAWTDNCDGAGEVLGTDESDGKTCPETITRTWSYTDKCGNSASVSQTIKVTDTTPPSLVGVPGDTAADCGNVPAVAEVTATDNCSGATVTMKEVTVEGQCAGNYTITRTWTAIDGCGNEASASQKITVTDTTPPTIACPPDALVPYPTVPDGAITVAELLLLGGSAEDACSEVTISYSDSEPAGECPRSFTRTYTATDACGNQASCEQIITQLCPSLVTNSSLCTFDIGGCDGNTFRLGFSQRPDAPNQYKLTNSNPGQFYYNVFLSGEPGDPVDATATIPYPFVTHGAQPIHVYSDYSLVRTDDEVCLIPSTAAPGFTIDTATGADGVQNKSPSGAEIIVLSDYSPAQRTTTVRIKDGVFPATGKLVITIHLDYAFKGTKEWTVDGTTAVGVGSLAGVRIDSCASYEFSSDLAGSEFDDSQIVHSVNSFKKNPGFGAAVTDHVDLGAMPRSGVKVEVWNAAKTAKIGETMTNEDGFAFIPYKHKAKAADYWIKVPAYNKTTKVTIKANGFGFGEFIVP